MEGDPVRGGRILAELPELTILAGQMNQELKGRRVRGVESHQPKCVNVPVEEFRIRLLGKTFGECRLIGKWIACDVEPGEIFLLNLGMGADLRFYPAPANDAPEKYQLRLEFEDGSALFCRFWWFGHTHVVARERLSEHPLTSVIGPLATGPDAGLQWFRELVAKSRGNVKSLLLDQRKISGLGNAYMHDILFVARVHPFRQCRTLGTEEVDRLFEAILYVSNRARELGGFETDLYGRGGYASSGDMLCIIGYKQGKPCPVCGTAIQKVKTGSTSGFVCPTCQKAS
jgi:formamidopyrimidine-DNA glycosylase